MSPDWAEHFPGAITVCDREGIILYMNDQARRVLAGDKEMVGLNVLSCHPEPARSKLADLLATGRSNTYTIEKNGNRKIIHQVPWYQDGEYRGLVELSLAIPWELPHFVRTPS